MEVYNTARQLYGHALNQTDVRSRSWLLMGSPVMPLATMVTYLGVVHYGPKLMRHRPAWDLKRCLVLYNFALVALSAYMFSEFLLVAVEEKYSLLCEDVDFSLRPNALRMLDVCWWYYFSKYIELADTIFFILRKKNGQITVLHVYHHATMVFFWWLVMAYVPGGESFFHPLLNSGIHVMMYTYYGLAAVGPQLQPYLWWKKYLTTMQIIQFLLISVHAGYNLFLEPNCPYPKTFAALALYYAFSLIVLFRNFYRQAYTRKHQQEHGKSGKKLEETDNRKDVASEQNGLKSNHRKDD